VGYKGLLAGKLRRGSSRHAGRTGSQNWAQLLTDARNQLSVFIRLQAKAPDELLC